MSPADLSVFQLDFVSEWTLSCHEVTFPAIHLGPAPKFCTKSGSPLENGRLFAPLLSWYRFWAS